MDIDTSLLRILSLYSFTSFYFFCTLESFVLMHQFPFLEMSVLKAIKKEYSELTHPK
uniref:Uncharacterized protein n=4 Tax=Cercopithecinae TaxID=9528 RepID=A0A2K5KVJ6_CERAT